MDPASPQQPSPEVPSEPAGIPSLPPPQAHAEEGLRLEGADLLRLWTLLETADREERAGRGVIRADDEVVLPLKGLIKTLELASPSPLRPPVNGILAPQADRGLRHGDEPTSVPQGESQDPMNMPLHALVEQVPMGVWVLSTQGAVIGCNERFLRMAGAPRDKVIGFNMLLQARDRSLVPHIEKALQGETVVVRMPYTSTTGNRRGLYRYAFQPIRHRGVLRGVLSLVEELEDPEKAEANPGGSSLTEARRDEILALAAHELRSPLTSISAYVQLVLSKLTADSDPFLRRALEVIARQSTRMGCMVSELLDASRMNASGLEVFYRSVDLSAVVREACEPFQVVSARHSWRLEGLEGPVHVQGDACRLAQVFTNLLANAVKFSPRGGELVVRLAQEAQHATVTVKDPGEGIPPEVRDRIFERFFRVPHRDRRVEGLGLGLAISREIVQLHGGDISFDSVVGEGTTFRVRLPLEKV